jgi:ketosteroid isomerase-like protein
MSIEDRLAIGDLLVRYANALDAGDVATVVDCFTADAVLESPVIGRIAGHAAIRAFAGRFAAQRAGGTQFRHMITNIAAEIEPGGMRARATAYLLVWITRDGASRPLPPGRYECDALKKAGTWRFCRRVVLHDHGYTLEGI